MKIYIFSAAIFISSVFISSCATHVIEIPDHPSFPPAAPSTITLVESYSPDPLGAQTNVASHVSTPVAYASASGHCTNIEDCNIYNDIGNNSESVLAFWIKNLQKKTKSQYQYFIGKGREDKFGPFEARRFLVILPSEYTRDSDSDWDCLEIVLAPLDSRTKSGYSSFWISTENYRQRKKAIFRFTPSPDWEYKNLEDNDTTNERLRSIASEIKSAAEKQNPL